LVLEKPGCSAGCLEHATKPIANRPTTVPIAVALRVMYFILVLHFDESLWVFLGTIVHAAEISKWKKYQSRNES
jgi:hypothetical protein